MRCITHLVIFSALLFSSCAHQRNTRVNGADTVKNIPPTAAEKHGITALHDRFLKGIDFIANGNEPSWSLEMDIDGKMKFSRLGKAEVSINTVKEVRLADVAAASYRVQTAAGLLNVIVYDKQCINNMSGDTMTKTVEVNLDGKKYNGCGQWLSDYRMHDIWVLRTINDSAIDEKLTRKPTLELNLSRNEVSGNSGCNGFGGQLEVKGNHISFGTLTGTMMYCEDGGFERRYLALLADKKLTYKVDSGSLFIYAPQSTLRFQKID